MISLKNEKILLGPSSFAAIDNTPIEKLIQTDCEIIDNPFKRKLTKTEIMELLSDEITGIEVVPNNISGFVPYVSISTGTAGIAFYIKVSSATDAYGNLVSGTVQVSLTNQAINKKILVKTLV